MNILTKWNLNNSDVNKEIIISLFLRVSMLRGFHSNQKITNDEFSLECCVNYLLSITWRRISTTLSFSFTFSHNSYLKEQIINVCVPPAMLVCSPDGKEQQYTCTIQSLFNVYQVFSYQYFENGLDKSQAKIVFNTAKEGTIQNVEL